MLELKDFESFFWLPSLLEYVKFLVFVFGNLAKYKVEKTKKFLQEEIKVEIRHKDRNTKKRL